LTTLWSKTLGYYQFAVYYTSSGAKTCTAGGKPLTLTGGSYGCMDFGDCTGVAPCSYGLTCDGSADSISLGAQLFMGPSCTGDVYSGSGAAQLNSLYKITYPNCVAPLYMKYSCASSGGAPASLYDGYRISTYFDSQVCMGEPLSYTEVYDTVAASYSCVNGILMKASAGTTVSTGFKNSCTAYPTMSVAYGCISASSSLSVRTFTTWTMTQTITGVAYSSWTGSNKNSYTIVLATTIADILGVDYESITNLSFAAVSGSADSVVCTYTLKIQAGFGNSYTAANVYSFVTAKAAAATSSSCVNGCFSAVLQTSASGVSGVSVAGATSTTFESAPPSTVTQGAPAAAAAPAPQESASGSTNGAAIVIGVLLVLGVVGIYLYKTHYAKQSNAAAAANAGLAPPPLVPAAPTRPAYPTNL